MKDMWWQEDTDLAHEKIFAHVKEVNSRQNFRSKMNERHLTLYGDLDIFKSRRSGHHNHRGGKLTLNIIQSLVDTVMAKIAKNNPRPRFLTDGGNISLQRRAEKLGKFIDGVFSFDKTYMKGKDVFKDGAILGDGVLKFRVEDGQIATERVLIEELTIDDREAMYGEFRQLHHVKFINKEILKTKFPKFKGDIEDAGSSIDTFLRDDEATLKVDVIESWHLPSGPNAKDGRHIISISGRTLLDEDWDLDWYPFEFFHYTKRPLGFFAQGIAENTTGIQIEINKILKRIHLAIHLGAVPRVLVSRQSKIVETHINNDIGAIINYTGEPPIFSAPNIVPPDLYIQLQFLISKAFELNGVSQLSASSQKPQGLDSGKAIREFNNIETERFAIIAQQYEEFFMDVAKKMIKMAKTFTEADDKYEVLAASNIDVETIKWSDVKIDEQNYIMKVWPTNLLPQSPAGRLATVAELTEAGFLDRSQAFSLLDFPDFEQFASLENAAINDIRFVITNIVDKGELNPPESSQDLDLGIRLLTASWLKYKNMGLEAPRLDMLLLWTEQATTLLAQRAALPPPEILPEEPIQTDLIDQVDQLGGL